MVEKNVIDWIAFVLVIIGGLNWLLVGLWQYNIVAEWFGSVSWLVTTIYVLVGIAALYMIYYVVKK